jgi:hAT family C-terminal dimerisation region
VPILYISATDRKAQINGAAFPTLFVMAMDYLPIQASAVPCERIFSSSAETNTKKRNRISPLLMEALQMLKFHLKKERLNFMQGWTTSEKLMTEDDPDVDLLRKLLEGDYQDALDSVIRSINTDEDF